jgi:Tol biopolymer transport system component
VLSLSPGGERKKVSQGNLNVYPSVSPDGKRVAYFAAGSGGTGLMSYDVVGNNLQRIDLPFEPWLIQDPVAYSPDSKWIYMCTTDTGKMGIWRVPADGSSPPQQFRKGAFMAPSISPDGQLMKVGKYDESTHQLVDVMLRMDGTGTAPTINLQPGRPLLVQWTPDGRGLSYIAEEHLFSAVAQPTISEAHVPRGRYHLLLFVGTEEQVDPGCWPTKLRRRSPHQPSGEVVSV